MRAPDDRQIKAEGEAHPARNRLHKGVSAAIESRILNGYLKVGDKLESEGALGREFGVSTRSIREAIQVLETKGLVQRRHGERTVVVREDVNEYLGTLAVTVRQKFRDDPDYLLHLMAVRRMVETEVVSMLTARDDPVAAEVTAALDGMLKARDTDDFAGFVDADVAFHLALVHSAGNPILTVLYDNLFGLIHEVIQVTSRVPSKSLDAAYSEHHDIWQQIANRDQIRATSLMRAQIDNSAAYLRVVLNQIRTKSQDD